MGRTPLAVGRTSTPEPTRAAAARMGAGRGLWLLGRGGSGAAPGHGAAAGAAHRCARGHRSPAVATHASAGGDRGGVRHIGIINLARILTETQGALLSEHLGHPGADLRAVPVGVGSSAAGGLAVILVWLPITTVADSTPLAETVAAYGFFLFAAALGAAARYRERVRVRDIGRRPRRENANSSRASFTTPSPTTSRVSLSRLKRVVRSRLLTPSVRSRPWSPSRMRRPARSPDCTPSSASCGPRGRPPITRRSPAWPRSNSSPRMGGRIPVSR